MSEKQQFSKVCIQLMFTKLFNVYSIELSKRRERERAASENREKKRERERERERERAERREIAKRY